MTKQRFACAGLLTAILLCLTSCVELTGQRIAWHYDEKADLLRVLIFYDGIHDTEVDVTDGTEKFTQFVKDGDVMLVDWFFHFQLGEARRAGLEPDASELDKQLAALLANLRVENLGYYKEPNGQLGAAQLVTISSAKHFVAGLNAIINREVLASGPTQDDTGQRTQAAMKDAARREHQWFALDGQAIRLRIPIDPEEWRGLKADGLSWFEEAIRTGDDADMQFSHMLLSLIASSAVAYSESGEEAIFTLGRTDATSVLRLPIRDSYSPNLEPAVVRNLGADLNHQLASETTGLDDADPRPHAQWIADFGPPEATVLALLDSAATNPDTAPRAIESLQLWATNWNNARKLPAAPLPSENQEAYLNAWKSWYESIK